MTKKTIILIVLFLILLGLIGAFFLFSKEPGEGSGTAETNSNDGFFGGLFPDNSQNVNTDESAISTEVQNNSDLVTGGSGLNSVQQLTNTPTAGYISTTTQEGQSVRYMEKRLGNVFDINLENLNTNRITNLTIPSIHSAVWQHNADTLLLQYENGSGVVKTILGQIVDDVSSSSDDVPKTIERRVLENDITGIAQSRSKDSFVTLRKTKFGSSGFVYANTDEFISVFDSPFSEWTLTWPNEETMVATTKASGLHDGSVYFIDSRSGDFRKILSGIRGLTTLTNPTGKYVLYSRGGVELETFIYNTETKRTTPFGLSTLPEKCVWSQKVTSVVYCGVPLTEIGDNFYPDDWYRGTQTFYDDLFMVDVEGQTLDQLVILSSVVEEGLDIQNISLTPNEDYLLFINKKDQTLWSLELDEIEEVEVVEEIEEAI